ncbi:uncharacterized protein L3040_009314 [Drepanopeziza brunnea f. sp. 'multigermtubi']|uniref:AB hydrolase-1 domain-containing protein n=1 Tax=Marssonina brunnea f. sp. multigermtubi (strain MB_m1) TaxID=1072389 RepID=K1X216_MARBU|nr:uncharacterized protein MBM_02483 [Drepanopeziza brunnea f. sp. 'multigermtubi' MB_m1]EKD19246.1 hypothetical protein MBM_02483 [Drepanopeziza brunnea f. sp. 'multigermtubi' MB_m1]KAJ5032720.1 hypothetical protein L3040_009314 [Drepanopeziza brunnea f. sp. 'multigermtubi']
MPFITHPSGQTTHYLVDDFTDPWKPKETIILQGGFGRHSAFWYHWVPILSRHYRVIRRDTRGHGLSSSPPFPSTDSSYDFSTDGIIGEIVDTLDQLGLKKVHFLGESTSGILGCILAAKHPDRLLSLTICSTPTHLPLGAQKLFAFGKSDWPTACLELGSRGWAQALSEVPGTMPSQEKGYAAWWVEQVGISKGEGLAGYANFLCSVDCRPHLAQITVPTLILAPMRSAATTVAEQESIQAQIRGSVLEFIDAAGHEIYVQEPEKCQQAFMSFLAGLPRGA